MGEDKALLDFNGKRFIEQISMELSCFEEKIIARGNNSSLTALENEGWLILPDIYPNHGPIGGLHAALLACAAEAMFCVSCDMPLLQHTLAKKLCEEMCEEYDAVIAVSKDAESGNDRIHPLCGVYKKEVYKIMEEHILEDNNRLMAILKKIRVKYVDLEQTSQSQQVMNVNTKNDYQNLKSI